MTKVKTRSADRISADAYDADVAAIVDAVLADPARADDAKALLTQKLGAPDVVRLAVPKSVRKSFSLREDADEDMWDNVPV